MKLDKEFIEYRYLFDIEKGVLHDLKGAKNPDNEGCGLEKIESWVCFDTERAPTRGALIKKLTSTREVVDIEVRRLCPHCMSAEDEELVGLLQDYFLARDD